MATLHIEHRISDLDTWLTAFKRSGQTRRNAGVRSQRVHQPVDDHHYIYIRLEFDSVDEPAAFKGFLENQVWASADTSPGLAGTPTARILNEVTTE